MLALYTRYPDDDRGFAVTGNPCQSTAMVKTTIVTIAFFGNPVLSDIQRQHTGESLQPVAFLLCQRFVRLLFSDDDANIYLIDSIIHGLFEFVNRF